MCVEYLPIQIDIYLVAFEKKQIFVMDLNVQVFLIVTFTFQTYKLRIIYKKNLIFMLLLKQYDINSAQPLKLHHDAHNFYQWNKDKKVFIKISYYDLSFR